MMLRCPAHHCFTPGGECPVCKQQGLHVVECEVDKIERVQDTMDQQGYTRSHYSYVVLIFYRGPEDPLEKLDKDPAARL